MDSQNLINCIVHCLELIIFSYGTWSVFSDIIYSKVPSSLLFLGSIVSLLCWFRAAPPNEDDVEKVLGKDLLDVTSTDENFIDVVAHRGASIDAPENTLAAYDNCKSKGCKAVELDVSITGDGVPIVFHDYSTSRMCHKDLEISTSTYEELKTLNLSDKHPKKHEFPVTRILKLDEAVEHLMKNKQKIIIDIKQRDPRNVKVILDLYEKHPKLYTEALITTFYPSVIYRIRRKDPRIIAALAWCPHAFYYGSKVSTLDGHFWTKAMYHTLDFILRWLLTRVLHFFVGFSVILLHRYSLDAEAIYEWTKRGVRVIAWTVNKPAEKKYCLEILKIPYLTDTLDENPSKIITLNPMDDYYNK